MTSDTQRTGAMRDTETKSELRELRSMIEGLQDSLDTTKARDRLAILERQMAIYADATDRLEMRLIEIAKRVPALAKTEPEV